ncbi:hypothetical protein IV498_04040 [Paenarthrobacter sp. Z7-10]|uniref:hypothetical protein n=1 Tax=Paenarthrobacter sp. Z7-10 TaxID=2787635 RepID=UPI0022A9DDCA|nr:hypothetical protein [Paenarthrobacter sp. Z7-10]MCZ2402373.1 hypothetical protein [Paenarthrobacter sp. Z7-10]
MTQPPLSGAQQYPPAVYAPAVPGDLTSAPPASLLRWFSSTAAAGIVVGALWWCLAPGGAFYGSGSDTAVWLPRDLVLGLIGLVAGIVTAALLLPQRRNAGSYTKILAAVAGSAAGSVIAWRLGTLAGDLWGHVPANPASDSIAFSLRSVSVLTLWPGICALIIFAVTLVSLLRSGPSDQK